MPLYPHETLPDALSLKVTSARLLASGLSLPIDNSEILLRDRPINEKQVTLEVSVAVSGPQADIEDYLHRHEGISATLIAHCRQSNLRQSIALDQHHRETEWHGAMLLDRRLLRGLTELKSVLTGTQNNRPYRYLGETDIVRIVSDDAAGAQHGGGLYDVRWRDFKAEERGRMRENHDQPTYIDLTTTPRPTLYLNTSFRGLRELLPNNNRPSGSRLPLNELLVIGIARSAYQAIAAAAFAAIRPEEDGEEPGVPEGWQGQAIKELLPHLYSGVSSAEALRLAQQGNSMDGLPDFQTALLTAINRRLRDGSVLRRALTSIEKQDAQLDATEEEE